MEHRKKNICFKIFSIPLIFALIFSTISVFSDEVQVTSEKRDDLHTKVFLNSYSQALNRLGEYFVSGWDLNTAGGQLKPVGKPLTMIDESEYLSVGATRQLEDITYGKIDFNFSFSVSSRMAGTSIALRSGDKPVIQFTLDTDMLYYVDADENLHPLTEYKTGVAYSIRTALDFDTHVVKTITVDGKRRAEDLSFTAAEEKADNFSFETGKKTTGNFALQNVYIARGYLINEDFSWNSGKKPADWEYIGAGQNFENLNAVQGAVSAFELGYAVFEAMDGEQKLLKHIDPFDRKAVYEFQLLFPEKRGGVTVALSGADTPIITLSADSDNFLYTGADGAEVPFYDYMKNVWYHFRVEVDTAAHSADLYLNGKPQAKGIPVLNGAFIDEACITVEAGTEEIWFDNVLLYPYEEVPEEDYVPAPVKAEKLPEYADIDVGMQFCPMWTEGLHFGWEYIERSPGRKPLLGCYDEPSPEVMDWSIKWMLEHGLDFIWCTFYKGGSPSTPVQDAYQTQLISNAYFYAKYSEQMPFAIFWENAVGGVWSSDQEYNRQCFLENFAPYLIEHYFKDPRYYKIDNRPIMGAYYLWYTFQNFGSGDNFKKFWQDFCDMCNERGVGDPILVQQMQMTDEKEYSDYLEMFQKAGVEATYPYHVFATVPADNIASNQTKAKWTREKQQSIQYIPNVSHGISDYAWGLNTGITLEPDEYKRALDGVLNEVMPELNASLGQKLMILGSWDEYGEGHYFAPTERFGFQMLDAIRSAFCGESEHSDILPTQQQKERFNNLYYSGREVPIVEKIVAPAIPSDAYVKQGWYFQEGTDIDDWEITGKLNKTEVADGAVHFTVDKGGSAVMSMKDLNIQLSDVTHLKLRVKNLSQSCAGRFGFATNLEPTINSKYTFTFDMETGDEYRELVIPVSRLKEWRGVLQEMKITLGGNTTQAEDCISVSAVELYAVREELSDACAVLSVDEVEQNVNYILKDEKPMIPLRTLAGALGGSVHWDSGAQEIVTLLGGNTSIYSEKTGQFSINHAARPSPPIEIIDGVTYVGLELAARMTDRDIMWDAQKRRISISVEKEVVFERPNDERTLIRSWEFNRDGNAEGWGGAWLYNATFKSVADGAYNFTGTGDAIVYSDYINALSIDTSQIKAICIGVKSEQAYNGILYYTTTNDTVMDPKKSYVYAGSSSAKTKEYTIYTDVLGDNWSGILHRLRFDFKCSTSNEVSIDYVRLYGDFERELSQKEYMERFDSMERGADKLSWNFDLNNSKDGWKFSKNAANIVCEKGKLKFQTLQSDAVMETIAPLDLNAEDVRSIEFRYKNKSGGTKAMLYFITEEDSSWDSRKAFRVDIVPNDKLSSIYKIKPSLNSLWSGKIRAFRLVPSDAAGQFEMDYFHVCFRE